MDNNYEIKYLPLALKDISDIAEYITFTLYNPEAADNLLDDIGRTVNEIQNFPFSGAIYSSKKKRKMQHRMKFVKNYTIYYVVNDNVILIERIIYKRKLFEVWKSMLKHRVHPMKSTLLWDLMLKFIDKQDGKIYNIFKSNLTIKYRKWQKKSSPWKRAIFLKIFGSS